MTICSLPTPALSFCKRELLSAYIVLREDFCKTASLNFKDKYQLLYTMPQALHEDVAEVLTRAPSPWGGTVLQDPEYQWWSSSTWTGLDWTLFTCVQWSLSLHLWSLEADCGPVPPGIPHTERQFFATLFLSVRTKEIEQGSGISGRAHSIFQEERKC